MVSRTHSSIYADEARTNAPSEIEFFIDINLTKDSSLLLPSIFSPFYWRILKKIIIYSDFNSPYKKICENSSLFMNSIL